MTTPMHDELPPRGAELEALLAVERELPPVPAGLDERLRARLAAVLGAGAGGAGGAGLGWLLKAL
ncbi:MAG TPA: hypothetical protein VHE35_19420, partial [Kofleriaceae bacterium]|nr:hypothetical protein [Kofleriaceae bacterium]